MRRQPSPYHGRLWRCLLAVLVLGGLGIWHGGHCPDDASVRPATTAVAGPAADTAVAPAATTTGHRDNPSRAALEAPHSAASDCHLVSSIESATTPNVTSVTAPAQQHSVIVIGAVVRRPAARPLAGRSLIEIGVSRT